MFQDDDLLALVKGDVIVQIDEDKRVFCARGQLFDVFCYDEGNGWSHILATQPASPDGQPTPEIRNLIFGLLNLCDVYAEDDKEQQ